MKSRIKKDEEKEKQNKTKQKKILQQVQNLIQTRKRTFWSGSKSVRCAPGGDLNQSNIYQRKVEKTCTCIIVSTCMINFRIESSYIFVLKT